MYETAQAIVVDKPRHAVLREIPLSPIDDDSLVVRTTTSAISVGTEMKVWSGLSGALGGELWYPLVPGYEEVGEIVHVGRHVKGFAVGDRVMANECRHYPDHCAAWGGQCSLIVKNAKTSPSPFDGCVKIPDEITDQQAVLAYLAAVAHKGIKRVNPQPGQTVLVIGLGMVGLSWVQLAKLAGCRVIAIEVNDKRLALGAKFADAVIDGKCADPAAALKDLTHGHKSDVVVECSGNPSVVTNLYQYLKDGGWGYDDAPGHIHLQADYPYPLMLTPYQSWFTKNMSMSLTCAIRPDGKAEMLKLIREGKFDVQTLLDSPMTLEMPVADAQKAYEHIEASNKDIFKILLKW